MEVFISYAREDSLLSDMIEHTLLEIEHVDVLRDVTTLEPGTRVPDRILGQIDASDLFIVLLTRNSIDSHWVQMEINRARDREKRLIPILEVGQSLAAVPGLPTDMEYIPYEPKQYRECSRLLTEHVRRILVDANATARERPQARSGSDLLSLDEQGIGTLKVSRSSETAPLLEKHLVRNARETIEKFILDPKLSRLVDLGMLSTDTRVVVMRPSTLHVLLEAGRSGGPLAFLYAGYEAGILYGIGVVRWFLQRSEEIFGSPGLPGDSFALLRTCLEIDRASGWGHIELQEVSDRRWEVGWGGRITVKRNFLSKSMGEATTSREAQQHAGFKEFWIGYLEGTFTSALLSWSGEWMKKKKETPLLVAQCLEEHTEDDSALSLGVQVRRPKYPATCEAVQSALLQPYIERNDSLVVRSARSVIEGLVREMAGSAGDSRERVTEAITWLARNVEGRAKGCCGKLQTNRNLLHTNAHELREPTREETREILCSTGASVLMACREIHLDDAQRDGLRAELMPHAQ